jgi:hypothetical protein
MYLARVAAIRIHGPNLGSPRPHGGEEDRPAVRHVCGAIITATRQGELGQRAAQKCCVLGSPGKGRLEHKPA